MDWLPDGSLLTLERGLGLLGLPIVITIRRTAALPAEPGTVLAPRTIAVLSTSRGWRVDNFEGLARHRGMKFFAVSDDKRERLPTHPAHLLRGVAADRGEEPRDGAGI